MTLEKLESKKLSEFQEIIVLMKSMGLIKEKPHWRSFNGQLGGTYYE